MTLVRKFKMRGGQEFAIDEVLDNNGCLIYSGRDESEESVVIPEMELNSFHSVQQTPGPLVCRAN